MQDFQRTIRDCAVRFRRWIILGGLLMVFSSPSESARVIDRFNFFVVTKQDELILVRANELLKDHSAWNQFDDRQCDDDRQEGKWSLYCALFEACFQVIGVEDPDRAAIQVVRRIIDHANRGKVSLHPLKSFNNSANTSFSDIKQVLSIALEVVRKQLKPEG
jgi:hypothetical protein